MKYSWMVVMVAVLVACAGCSGDKGNNNDNKIDDNGHGELNLVARSPEETFQGVKRGMLEGDMDMVYKFYSKTLRLVQDRQGLQAAFDVKGEEFRARFQGSRILPQSMQFVDERRAVCRIKWGSGEITAYTFVYEEDGWKLGRELVAVNRNDQ